MAVATTSPPTTTPKRRRAAKPTRKIGPPPGAPMRIANLEVDRLCIRTPGGTGSIWFGFEPTTGYPRIYITDERGGPRVELGAYDGQWSVILRGPSSPRQFGAPRAAVTLFEESGIAQAAVYDGEGVPVKCIAAKETPPPTAREAAKAAELEAAKQEAGR